MERHARDSYYINGEGVLSGDAEGNPVVRIASEQERIRRFRFSRLGPKGTRVDPEILVALATAVTTATPPDPDSADVPAGYTYLGQFVDHDLTKDVTAVALGTDITVHELMQGRSPELDLDSLYGRGPRDADSRPIYADTARLKLGSTQATGFPDAGVNLDMPGFDVPRVGLDPTRTQTKADQRLPLIADARNEENLPLAQTYLAFVRFHNRQVDRLQEIGVQEPDLFERAQDIVVRHYQWMLRTDFLPRVVDPAIVNDVFTNGRRFFEPEPDPNEPPTMPIEFSVAAYRFGHSMVRGAYQWNRVFNSAQGGPGNAATLLQLFTFTGVAGIFSPVSTPEALDDPNAGTNLRLPSNWIADFRRLYDFTTAGRADLAAPPNGGNLAKRIDTRIVDPLHDLPLGTFGARGTTTPAIQRNLAFRNLLRANMVQLASGQQMAALFGVTPLTRAELLTGTGGADLSGLAPQQQDELVAHTPLWFYMLREAEVGAGRLGAVGGRIVAEVFHRAMEGSRISIVRDSAWRPTLGPDHQTFRMVDLLLVGAGGQASVINPLGDTAPAVAAPSQRAVSVEQPQGAHPRP